MSNRKEKIQKRIALMKAKKTMKDLSYVELINIEEDGSIWLDVIAAPLKQFRRIGPKSAFIKMMDEHNSTISWLENEVNFLKEEREWLILVPNSSWPVCVWANVKVLDFSKAMTELWEASENGDLIIASKSSGFIIELLTKDKHFELYIGQCDTLI
ncbi:hypothetical protein [Halalkalibacter sp. APA_J-10(15)]|uniref:hypothetical protein n=1 Tax=Halalkalibacter sp. APA_J-10(15) TaxID=2933805 RepID=UPI001FF3D7B1|nr:hypothetical protein [Halalkalibacter sp. APA_J-10(15)]MCK0473221.1 hypothetical protein [Halalkalibacter sp. APA_J-10(15)]